MLSILLLPTLLLFLKVPKGKNTSEIQGKKEVQPRVFLNLFKDKKIHRLLGISFLAYLDFMAFWPGCPPIWKRLWDIRSKRPVWSWHLWWSLKSSGPLSGKLSDIVGQRKSTLIIGSILAAGCCLWLIFLNDTGIYCTAFVIGIAISWSLVRCWLSPLKWFILVARDRLLVPWTRLVN